MAFGLLRRWLLACLLIVPTAALSYGTPDGAAPGPAPQDPAGRKVFTHKEHVPDLWLDAGVPETWRDCRGCHRYDEQRLASAPQQECAACHVVGPGRFEPLFEPGWEQDLSRYRTRTRDAFRHHTHAMLECRECHLPKNVAFLTDFDVRTGPGQCARCHAERADQAAAVAMVAGLRWFRGALAAPDPERPELPVFTPPAAADAAAYARKLVQVFAGPTGGLNTVPLPVGGDFDHDDHPGIGCVECHTNIPRASAREVGTGQIPTKGCGSCHLVDEARTAAAAAPSTQKQVRPLFALGAFVHADHYPPPGRRKPGVATDAAYELLAKSDQNGCDVCHVPVAPGVPGSGRDFPFAGATSRHTYLACAVCHDVPGWRTGETAAAPLHDSSDGNVDGAGQWQRCATCHVVGQPGLATVRPQVEVVRRRDATFVFPANTHPDITQRGVDQSGRPALQDCTECHRARVPELSSRLERAVFRHATHLPAQPTAQDCRGCHPGAATAADAPTLADAAFRTYSLAGCSSCHWGGEVREAAGPEPARAAVVAFPHAPHVAAGAACTDCHTLDSGGADIATRPEALACRQCHDHDQQNGGPKAEGLFDGGAASCARCHHADGAPGTEPTESVPPPRGSALAADDPRYATEQELFGGFAASQYHPLGDDCASCHKGVLSPDPGRPGIRLPKQDHLYGRKLASVHGDGPKQPASCLGCHWRTNAGLDAGVLTADGTPEQKQFRKRPESAATRREFGNSAAGYPGARARG